MVPLLKSWFFNLFIIIVKFFLKYWLLGLVFISKLFHLFTCEFKFGL